MSATFPRRPRACAWLTLGAALAACPALGADKPATPDGARKLQALFDQFLPPPPAFVTVKPGGENYLVSADLGALNGVFKAVGAAVAYDPVTLVYKLFEQDDGKWRVVQDSMPKIVSHAAEGTSAIEIDNFKQTVVVDPALAWWVSGSANADNGALTMRAPKIDQTINFGPVSGSYKTTVRRRRRRVDLGQRGNQ